MAGLITIDEDILVNICPDNSSGKNVVIAELDIQLPKQPPKNKILFNDLPKAEQRWQRTPLPEDLKKVTSMEEWMTMPESFRKLHTNYIAQEYERRRSGVWFYNNGVPTYITGNHYFFLQWSKIDIGYPDYLEFQRELYIHLEACSVDPRCLGQIYVKCRRSGYTNMSASILVNEGTQVKEKLLGLMSKTGADAQENIFMKKVVPIYKSLPFFFKPIQDGTTNPRMELAFREPSKRITKKNKTSKSGEALNTVINWKSTTNNAYDGEKLHILYLDEAGKWEKPTDIRESWRIHRTCLLVGRKIVGKSLVGSTVNPLDKGGRQFRDLYDSSNPLERNENGRTKSGLYSIFIPSYDALEGFFDIYGIPVSEDPPKPTASNDGELITIGARTFLKNERKALVGDSYELNEVIRQFPFTVAEAFRDSAKASLFNVQKIYEQVQHNQEMFPSPIVVGNFVWQDGVLDTQVIFKPDPNGRWRIAWLPPDELRNKIKPENDWLGCGGVDSYDIDATVDGRGSKGACHLYNKFNMAHPSNMFVAEYASRPPLAKIFYEDVLMASKYYGYPILIENNKYGIARHFETRGYSDWLMDRPTHIGSGFGTKTKTKGIPSNSQDIIQSHAQAIESYVHNYVGLNEESLEFGTMYFERTLEDWVNFKVDDRTKFDLSISSGLALLASQSTTKQKPKSDMNLKKFFRKGQIIIR
tara:strand:- start:3267 stop:5363 length:2097 start_codon:yes stop_codon:yes gene_type:complete